MLKQPLKSLLSQIKNLNLLTFRMACHQKVIIVGAGVSGLSAASTFLTRGIDDILLLEAHNRIGGRIHSVDDGNGGIFERGAQWLHGDVNNPLYKKFSDLKYIEDKGETLDDVGLLTESRYSKFHDSDGCEISSEILQLAGQIDWSIDEKVKELYRIGGDIEILKQNAFDEALKKLVSNPSEKLCHVLVSIIKFSELLAAGVEGINPYDRSRLISDHYFDDCGGKNFCFPRGLQLFINDLSSKLHDKVHLNTPVIEIKWKNGNNGIEIATNNRKYTADACIVTCSLGVLKSQPELFVPSLPNRKMEALDMLHFGMVEKIGLVFDESWWGEMEGYYFIDTGQTDEFIHRMSTITGDQDLWWREITGLAANSNNANVLSLWLSGQAAHRSLQYDDTVIVNVVKQLLMLYTKIDMKNPRQVIRTNWSTDKYFCGSYSGITENYKPEYALEMSTPLTHNDKPVLLFSGEAYHHCHMSTIHGAYQHGQLQAKKLADSMEE